MYVIIALMVWAMAAQALPFSGDKAKAYLDTLCRPEFAGRKSGEPQAARCEHWVAESFCEFGLQPAIGPSYLQEFPILSNHEEMASLALLDGYHGKKQYQDGEDFNLITNSGSGRVQAEVVFCGYGICQPQKGRDDFEGVSLKGKIALILRDVPEPKRYWHEQDNRDSKLKAAVEHGAVAVLFVHEQYSLSGAAIHQEAFHPDIPVILVAENVVEDLLRGTGHRYATVKSDLKKAPQSFATHKRMKIQTRLTYNPSAQAANVIGVLPGSDPTLKDEWLVIGGHLDHNGVNAVGDVYYGADDNASGASLVIELAREFASLEKPPARSLMFIAFAGEEQGLLGSEYFVNHPVVPLEKIAAMLNFDCCGMGDGGIGFGGPEHFPEIWQAYKAGIPADSLKNMTISTHWGNGSDNHSFHEKGIPTFNYWSRGDRSFYHHQEDLPDKINVAALQNVGQAAADFIAYLAAWDKPLITSHYRAKNWLNSSCAVDLKPIPFTELADTTALLNKLHTRQLLGLKCATVAITAEEPYRQVDSWRQFCAGHDLVWAKNADDIRGAVRQQKLALLPVLVHLSQFDRCCSQLANLSELGARIAVVEEMDGDSAAANIARCHELGMTFLVNCEQELLLPEKAKRLVNCSGCDQFCLPPEEDLGFCRAAVSSPKEISPPDSGKIAERAVYLNLNWENNEARESSLRLIEELEKVGYSGDQIIYMLGENLLEILP